MDNENISVLIIEDNPADAYLIQMLLCESIFQKFHIKHSSNLYDALEYISKENFNVILLDLHLPDTIGLEALGKINNLNSSIPIIVLTGLDKNLGIQVLKLGAQDYLTKNEINSELLIRTIKYAIERKKLLEKLKIQAKKLEELNKSKDKFFSIISHDLKSPFQGLLGFSEVLVNDYNNLPAEDIKNYNKIIFETTRSIYDLIENLLQWSRIQTGRIEFKPGKINIYERVELNINLIKNLAAEKGVTIINEVNDDLFAYTDYTMLSSVIQNLLSNAIKFTSQGGFVKILAKRLNGVVEIRVVDSGIGMEENEIGKLFRYDSLFSRFGTKGERGTGLGLLICKELLEKNNGEISVESIPGKGSEFIVTLPNC